MRKHMFSLKKQIVRVSWLLIITVILFLLTFLFCSIYSFQNKNRVKRMEAMAQYAEVLDNNQAQLRNVIGEIYTQNSYFNALNPMNSVSEQWDCIYDLMNILNIQEKGNKNIEGLLLYYNSFENVQYVMEDTLSLSDMKEIKASGKQKLVNENRNYVTDVEQSNGKSWLSTYMKKETSAIGGFISLCSGLPDELERNAIYGVIADGKLYVTGGDAEDNPEFFQKMADEGVYGNLQTGENYCNKMLVYLYPMESTDMSVVEILPVDMWVYLNGFHIAYMILIIIFLFASIQIEKFVYHELSRPLSDMKEALQNISAGVWEVDFSAPNRILEIEDVRESIKVLLAEIEQYKIRVYEEELKKEKIQSQYLCLQLTPHFYTNCLKNAYYMLALKEYENVEIFIQRLSVHLRYLLQQEKTFVTVGEEIEFVNNYIDLQKLMSSKQLECKISADEKTLHQKIPILTIQTFVENSVKYARNLNNDLLIIQISVRDRNTEEGRYMDITVKDNGSGYSEEFLHAINLQYPEENAKIGIGITNLQNRLRLIYGENASWYFENRNGAISEVILPERTEAIK